jgi:cytochrome c peroxidase
MRPTACLVGLVAAALLVAAAHADESAGAPKPFGLPPVPIPEDNPQTPEKIALGEKLFHDKRFSSTGEVACANCHAPEKAFTDGPLTVSEGIRKLTGTRNAPTVINAAYLETQFWDGRSPSLEDQALHPFLNPVEMGLPDHEPILKIVRTDPEYAGAFETVFGTSGEAITMDEVTKAIAAFERTVVAAESPFDHWYFGGDEAALTAAQKRGFDLFVRCSPTTVSTTLASASTGSRTTSRSWPTRSSRRMRPCPRSTRRS